MQNEKCEEHRQKHHLLSIPQSMAVHISQMLQSCQIPVPIKKQTMLLQFKTSALPQVLYRRPRCSIPSVFSRLVLLFMGNALQIRTSDTRREHTDAVDFSKSEHSDAAEIGTDRKAYTKDLSGEKPVGHAKNNSLEAPAPNLNPADPSGSSTTTLSADPIVVWC